LSGTHFQLQSHLLVEMAMVGRKFDRHEYLLSDGVASAIVCDGVSAAAVVFAPEYGNEDDHPI
jgi:cobalamin-dependent methionine synthase I